MFGLLAVPFAALATSLGASAVAAQVAGAIGAIVIGAGLSLVAGLLLMPKTPEPSSGQIETQQQTPERFFYYGRGEASGPLGMKKVVPPGVLVKTLILSDGEIDAIETTKGDDAVLTFDENRYVNNYFIQDGDKKVQIFPHMGTDDQTADPVLMEWMPALWTTNHRMRGVAYLSIILHGASSTDFLGAYPHGEIVVKVVFRGRRVWDPRDPDQDSAIKASFLWSDNPSLCILDWLCLHPKGYRLPLGSFHIADFMALANTCDELVPLKTGGSEKRYRVSMKVPLHTQKRTVTLAQLRAACDARIYLRSDGKYGIRGGKWTAPTETLDVARGHVLAATRQNGVDAQSRWNEAAVRYLSPDHNYAEAEADPFQALDDPELIAGTYRTISADWMQVPSHGQAKRLTKIRQARENPDWLLTGVKTNFYGLNLVGEETANVAWTEGARVLDDVFWLEPKMTILPNLVGTVLSLRSADPAAYDWDPDTEEGTAPSVVAPIEIEFERGTPPDNPATFEVLPGPRSATISWEIESDDLYIARVWRAADGDPFDDAIQVSGPRYRPRNSEVGDTQVWSDTVMAGDYCYYMTFENPIGERNTPVGPVCVTIPVSGEYSITDDAEVLLMDDEGNELTMAA